LFKGCNLSLGSRVKIKILFAFADLYFIFTTL
jgi:hypothetical protein